MKLLHLEAQNLFSIGEISLSLQARGLTLVTGFSRDEGSSNGAGKSSVANKAVLWTLYGQTAGGIRADSVLNRHGKKKGFGLIEFIGVDGSKYTVRRDRPAKLCLSQDGKDVSSKKAADTQASVDAALGMNFATFIQTAFFGQGRAMSYPSLTPKDQKALLEEILPMEDIDRWAKYADVEAKKLKLDLVGAERAVVAVEAEQTTLTSQLKQAEAKSEGWAFQHGDVIERDHIQIKGAEADHARALDQINQTRKTFENVTVKGLGIEITGYQGDHAKVRDAQLEVVRNQSDAMQSCREWKARITTLVAERKDLEAATACSACLRPYDDSTVKSVKDRMQNNEAVIVEAKLNFEQAGKASVFYDNELCAARTAMADYERRIEDLRATIERVREIDVVEARKVAIFDRVIFELRLGLESHEKQTNPHLDYIESATEQLAEVSNNWLEAQTALGRVNSEMEHLIYWRDVYSKELKLKLFETCCAFLDHRTDEHLKGLRNEQLHVEFSTVKRLASGDSKDEFSVHVWSETGGVGFDSLSGGEQQMASFAVGLALADLASGRIEGSSEFLILDEPFSQLDERNSEAIVEYLSGEFGQGKDTTLLISNEEVLKGLIPNRIHVVKHMGITEIDNED
jgi:DNA repair exonuclease SbcCD ATPase subunit